MISIKAHIRHGSYNETLRATGETVSDCITKLAGENTYIPTPEFSKYSKQLIKDLESTGRGAMGWVDYEVALDPQEWQISRHATPDSNPQYGIHNGGSDFCIVHNCDDPKARAELIVRAVNSHAELLAAFESIAASLALCLESPMRAKAWQEVSEINLRHVRSAIAKARQS